jgi:hypothetical protein
MIMSNTVELKFFKSVTGQVLAFKVTNEGVDRLQANEALIEGARMGMSEFVDGLLTKGEADGGQEKVDVNAKNEQGQTAMHLAIIGSKNWRSEQEYLKIVQRLLEANADVDAKDSDGRTPMHYAVKYFNSDARKLLLQEGNPDVGIRDVNGDCPLQTAAIWPNIEAVHALIPVYMKQRKYKQLAQVLLEGYLNKWPRASSYAVEYKRFFRKALISFLSEAQSLADNTIVCPFVEITDIHDISVEQYNAWLKWADTLL